MTKQTLEQIALFLVAVGGVVWADIVCPNILHGKHQYREDWIALRDCVFRRLWFVFFTRRCEVANSIVRFVVSQPEWRRE